MAKGYLALVLHAHLPYVRHPEHDDFLEEDWLFEAITETYIPLLDIYRSLVDDGVKFQITMSLTPPLMNMLANELLQYRYVRHIEKLIRLAEMECERTKHDWQYRRTAEMYLDKFRRARDIFVNRYHCNLNNGFREFLERGVLEVITCGGTHGFFPLMQDHPKAIDAQLTAAVRTHEKHLGQRPTGIWLAECGFFPGVEKHLNDHGIKYFFVDSHGVLYADKRPKFGVYAPIICSRQNPVAAFGRDIESSKSVWSAEEGYPGDSRYREFYRDIGFDLPLDYIGPFIHEGGLRKNTGIKYHKITGKNVEKQPYNYDDAMAIAAEHAGNFMFNRGKQVEHLAEFFDRPPIIISPYDAELFGHWWYEGPYFINFLIRKIAYDQNIVEMITPKEYLKRHPVNQISMPSFSSWGHKGYCEVWLEGSNDWIYRHLHKAAERMTELADTYYHESGLYEEALNQAARELLLAQSSDWAFIMKMGTTVEYAVRRTKLHLNRFTDLYYAVKNRDLNTEHLRKLQLRDDIFPEVDYRMYASRR